MHLAPNDRTLISHPPLRWIWLHNYFIRKVVLLVSANPSEPAIGATDGRKDESEGETRSGQKCMDMSFECGQSGPCSGLF